MSFLQRILLSLSVLILLFHSSLPHSHAACLSAGEEQPCLASSPDFDYLDAFLQFNPAPNHLEDFYPSSDCDMLPVAAQVVLDLPNFLTFSYSNAATAAVSVDVFLLQLFPKQTAHNEGFLPLQRKLCARTRPTRVP